MSLAVFDQNDIERFIFYLKLGPEERLSYSDLYFRLETVEREDVRNQTDVANLIKGWLDKLDQMQEAIDKELEEGGGVTGSTTKKVDGEYSQTIGRPSGVASTAVLPQNRGRSDRMRALIQDINRELWYTNRHKRIPLYRSYPNVQTDSRTVWQVVPGWR